MPGWYGVANVEWVSEIRLREDRYLGNFQARWYRSLRGVGWHWGRRRSGDAVGGDRSYAHAIEVCDRARLKEVERISGVWLRFE
jgi:DMSO/TMAO reductase YedYZ molybdopterin-dependent catalytic subunit